jgi:hypothetical protein
LGLINDSIHAITPKWFSNTKAVLSVSEVQDIRNRLKAGEYKTHIAKDYSYDLVMKIKDNLIYKDI